MKIISVKDLTREYKSTKGWFKQTSTKLMALDGISFDISRGEIFGLLGPNGAGKTTTIKILSTLLAPTSGSAKVLGYDTFGQEKLVRQKINFIFGGEMGVYRRISARENLIYFSNLYKIPKSTSAPRIEQLLELVGLSDKADLKLETFSKGMIQRLQIARGLINDPEIIFLDEPSIGLDPVGAKELRDLIRLLKERGKTILLTTHYMHEADELCDRIAIINKGKIIAMDTPKNLKKNTNKVDVLEVAVLGVYKKQTDEIQKIEGVTLVSVGKNDQVQVLQIQYENQFDISAKVLKVLEGTQVLSIHTREATLEDAYISLVGGGV